MSYCEDYLRRLNIICHRDSSGLDIILLFNKDMSYSSGPRDLTKIQQAVDWNCAEMKPYRRIYAFDSA